jgi:hypothetical protein
MNFFASFLTVLKKIVYFLYSIMQTFKPKAQKMDQKTKHVFNIQVSQYSIYISLRVLYLKTGQKRYTLTSARLLANSVPL